MFLRLGLALLLTLDLAGLLRARRFLILRLGERFFFFLIRSSCGSPVVLGVLESSATFFPFSRLPMFTLALMVKVKTTVTPSRIWNLRESCGVISAVN